VQRLTGGKMKKKKIKSLYDKEEKRHDKAYKKENTKHEKKHDKGMEEAFRSTGKCGKK
jgi:hypothetical protein